MMFSMTFDGRSFTPKERIELLERSILVNSFAYYELNENILADHQYDQNTIQLEQYSKQFPADFIKSRYYEYFRDFCSEDDSTHNSSGFDLLERVRNADKDLYRRINIDACLALDLKLKRGITS